MLSIDLTLTALPLAPTQTSIILFLVSSSPSSERETRIKIPSIPELENWRANVTAKDLPKPRLAPVIKQQGLEPPQNIISQRTQLLVSHQ